MNQTQQPSNRGTIDDGYPPDSALLYMFVFVFAIIGICVFISKLVEWIKEHRQK